MNECCTKRKLNFPHFLKGELSQCITHALLQAALKGLFIN